jgi:diguanylate cyclase (GGDEF)-like protein
VPVLVRLPADLLDELLPALRACDDACLRDEPPALLAHRLRRLLAGSDLDSMTGLLNRRAFHARLEAELQSAGPQQPLSLLFLDLDHLKRINDEHGHQVGDRVIQHCAGLLPAQGVIAARMGPGQFAVLVPTADEALALACANRLCEIVRSHPSPDGVAFTVSVGASTTEQPLPVLDFIQQSADALYAAKRGGRDRAEHVRALERQVLRAGGDPRIENFDIMQRVLSERLADTVTRRSRRLLEALQDQADRDALTGLFNRRYLDRRLAHDRQEARRSAGAFSVGLLDIDFFGPINKKHGWPTGDRALRQVANLVRDHVREDDWVARYGGEEIAVVLPGASRESAVLVMERVRVAVAGFAFRTTRGEPFSVTVSAGVVEAEPDEELDRLWQRLSDRLLEAKNSGRNQVRG